MYVNDFRLSKYTCPVDTCERHKLGFETLKEKKAHVSLKHSTTKKAKR
jgi:hypothetical protein